MREVGNVGDFATVKTVAAGVLGGNSASERAKRMPGRSLVAVANDNKIVRKSSD